MLGVCRGDIVPGSAKSLRSSPGPPEAWVIEPEMVRVKGFSNLAKARTFGAEGFPVVFPRGWSPVCGEARGGQTKWWSGMVAPTWAEQWISKARVGWA
jgi:hypothetical protein